MILTRRIWVVFVISMVIVGCEKDVSPVLEQALVFNANYRHYFWDDSLGDERYIPNVWGYGTLTGDPLPTINYFTMNGDTFRAGSNYHLDYGSLDIGRNHTGSDIRIFENIDPLTVEMNTSAGVINGTVSLPDSVMNIQLDTTGHISVNTRFSVDWECQNADYFLVYVSQTIHDSLGTHHLYVNEIVTETAISFPDTLFSRPGRLSRFRITPINGPIPSDNMSPNMTGDGFGYLSYHRLPTYSDEYIEFVEAE